MTLPMGKAMEMSSIRAANCHVRPGLMVGIPI